MWRRTVDSVSVIFKFRQCLICKTLLELLNSNLMLSVFCSFHIWRSPLLQFRYKRRVYTQTLLDDKQFAKLHTKVRLESRLWAQSPGSMFSTNGLSQWAVVCYRESTRSWDVSAFLACQNTSHLCKHTGVCQSLGWFRWGCKLKDSTKLWRGACTGRSMHCVRVLVDGYLVGLVSAGDLAASFPQGGKAEVHTMGQFKRNSVCWPG